MSFHKIEDESKDYWRKRTNILSIIIGHPAQMVGYIGGNKKSSELEVTGF